MCTNCSQNSNIFNNQIIQGLNGKYGGYSSGWLFDSSSTSGSPSINFFRLNNTNFSTTTQILVNSTNEDNNDLSAFLMSFNQTGNYGNLRLFKEYDSSIYVDYNVTAIASSGSLYTLVVTYIGSNSFFSANDSVIFSFVSNGTNGKGIASIVKIGTVGLVDTYQITYTDSSQQNYTVTNGATGNNGIQGLYGGYSQPWLFDSSTSVSPSSFFLRLNNSTPASATHIYISDTTSDSINGVGFLNSLINNGLYGYLRIAKQSDSTKFILAQITNVTIASGYYDITITYIGGNSTFTTNDPLFVTFSGNASSGTSNVMIYRGKLPSAAQGTDVTLIPGTTSGDTLIYTDPLNSFNLTNGIWTCPTTGYYNLSYMVYSSTTLGTGYWYTSLKNTITSSPVCGNAISFYTGASGIIPISASINYYNITSGTTILLDFVNAINQPLIGNANGDGGNSSQFFEIHINRVG